MYNLKQVTLLIFCMIYTSSIGSTEENIEETPDIKSYLEQVNKNLAILYNEQVALNWKNEVIEKDDELLKEKQSLEITHKIMEYIKYVREELKSKEWFSSIGLEPIVKRQLEKLPKLGYEILEPDDFIEITGVTMNMSMIYKRVQLCSYQDTNQCNLTLIPDVQDILHTTNDINEIEYYWLEWRTKSGGQIKDAFEKFVRLYRKTAELNGFDNPTDFWFRNFDNSDQVLPELEIVLYELHPLYEQFHAHVRNLLRVKYGSEMIQPYLPYPQHLAEIFIGEAYRDQEGKNIIFPYPEKRLPNMTEGLLAKEYTPEKFYNLSQEFFRSIGLPELPESFWTENSFPKVDPSETYLTCWNKAYNFYESDLVTLSYCPQVDQRRYLQMFESMADIYIYKSFKDQLTVFQDEPLPNFNEAFSKVFTLSVSTPRYLEKLDIFPQGTYDWETRINRLYFQGLQEVFLIPILFTLDKYRVEILSNATHSWDNCAYWNLNEKYTGAMAPVKRTNQDFDAPSKLLIGVDEVYSGIIMGTIIQYQVYKSFCEEIGQYKKDDPEWPLDNCDLSGHPELGEKIIKAMALGSSKPWKYVLETLTGEKDLNPAGFLEYFEPLKQWLTENNQINGIEVGWIESKQCES